MILIALLSSALAGIGPAQPAGAGPAPPAADYWILTCDMPAAGVGASASGQRTFRLGPKSLQEWKPEREAFSSNYCNSFSCVAQPGLMEGSISSASLTLTISLEPKSRSATWRTAGASGLARTSGPCSVEPEPAARTPPRGLRP